MNEEVKIEEKNFKKIGFGTSIYRGFRKARQSLINFILLVITAVLFFVLPNSIYLIVFLFIFYLAINFMLGKLISLKYLLRFDLTNDSFQLKQMSQSTLSEYKVLDETGTPCKYSYGLKAGKDEVLVFDGIDSEERIIKANPVFSDIQLMVDVKNALIHIKQKFIMEHRKRIELENLLAVRVVEEAFDMTMKNPLLELLYDAENTKEVKKDDATTDNNGQQTSQEVKGD